MSSAFCAVSFGTLAPSAVKLDHLQRQPVVDDLRLDGGAPSALQSMVPSPGLVVTPPLTKLPSTGMASWIDCLMPSEDQLTVAVQRADRALRVVVVVQVDVVDVEAGLHTFGLAHLVARRLHRDVAVVLGEVLPQHQRAGPKDTWPGPAPHMPRPGHLVARDVTGVQSPPTARRRQAATMTRTRMIDTGSREAAFSFHRCRMVSMRRRGLAVGRR